MVLNMRRVNLVSIGIIMCVAAFVVGCAPGAMRDDSVLAVVDGDPITKADLEYAIQVAHRREDLSKAGSLNLNEYLDKIVEDKLLSEEARRMGLDQLADIRRAVDAYILRESVTKLYIEEIRDKVTVSDEEITAYYKGNYERFTLDSIRMKTKEEAERALEQLRGGSDFNEIAKDYPGSGQIVVIRRQLSSRPSLEEVVLGLIPGEISDIIENEDDYLIIKLISREKPADEELEKRKGSLAATIRKQKEDERAEGYLVRLRKEASIKINNEILSAMTPENVEEWMNDKRTLAEVYGSTLSVGEFAAMLKPEVSNEQTLNNWVDIKLVDHEALGKDYIKQAKFERAVRRYEDNLIRNTYIVRVIVPQIEVSEDALKEYYSNNMEEYRASARYKLQQITLKTEEEARDVLESLKGGADFSWLAKTKSIDEASYEGGDIGWQSISELPEAVGDVVKTLEVGDVSPVIELDPEQYRIIRVQMKTEEKTENFEKVKGAVYKDYFDSKVKGTMDKYISQLRSEAEIKIYRQRVKSMERNFGR